MTSEQLKLHQYLCEISGTCQLLANSLTASAMFSLGRSGFSSIASRNACLAIDSAASSLEI
ncbi:MAG: hypothetical protein QE275_00815 [Actinomycetota bacterium]|nr:hypothetical protein [Actinomycetota bacterium]